MRKLIPLHKDRGIVYWLNTERVVGIGRNKNFNSPYKSYVDLDAGGDDNHQEFFTETPEEIATLINKNDAPEPRDPPGYEGGFADNH